jgi:iron complex outermembrane recepter protein
VNRAFSVLFLASPLFVTLPLASARADDSGGPPATAVPTITVIGTSPVPGATIDSDKVPSNVETVQTSDLTRDGRTSLTGALNGQLGSININDTLADPFQPDILYRGFEASPVLGTPQGLAVYQNGVRINEAFGDAVNWDLLPDIAISRIDIVSANPVYGLNALGGAATITMKDGFSYRGGEMELSGGSFSQRTASAQFGVNDGHLGFYAAGTALDEDGWRLFAHDRVRQFYTALSEHGDSATIDLTYTHADNQLFGQGAAPVQSLALSPENVFTGPQSNLNRLDFVTLDGSYAVGNDSSVQSVFYYRDYRQSVTNGNKTNFTACTTDAAAGLLCQADGVTPLSNAAGQTLPDVSNGGNTPIGENDFESIHSRGFGGSAQFHGVQALVGHGNQFTVGATADVSHVNFSSGAQIGVIDASLIVLPSDLVVDTPEGSGFRSTPVVLKETNKYYGFFATDTFDVTSGFAVTASGRYNIAQIDLYDQRGTDLNGLNRYTHFNPALGATYKLSPDVTAYGGYSMTNRAPTASEIECSDPLRPCLLPANLAGDPPTLKQVIARTYELGLRGRVGSSDGAASAMTWNVGAFRTSLDDDIYAIATSLSSGFFQNIGSTRRQGAQAGVTYRWGRGLAYLNYSYVDATFESAFTMRSSSNPAQDANGNIQVLAGDRLPGIPRHRVKAGLDYSVLPGWTVGGTLVYASPQFYRGDESNQNAQLPGYQVLGLHTSYQFRRTAEVFITVQNVFDRHYATYGIYSDPTGVGAPGIPADAGSNDPRVDNRFQSPAAPRAVFGGVRITF